MANTKIVLNRQSDLILDNAQITAPVGIVLTDISGVSEAVASINTATSLDMSAEASERMVYDFITIDDYCKKNNIEKLDFIKIDVDSYDFDLLKGAVKTLESLKPTITIELNYALNFRNATEQDVIDWLTARDYSLAYVTNDQNHTFIHNSKL
jgi:FkbM family methyltransferase